MNTKSKSHFSVQLPTDRAMVPKPVRNGIFIGDYENTEARMVQAALTDGDRVLEIGTGIGFISVLCAKICGPDRVWSFEANPAVKPLIQKTYQLNGVTPKLHIKAVTTDGTPLTFFAADNLISSSKFDRSCSGRWVNVDSVPFANVMRDHQPTVVVMDTEGAEVDLLTDADLAGLRCLILETHPNIVGDKPIANLLSSLNRQGFETTAHFQKNAILTRAV
ncbi:MAG: FkbM family methyltransferase [Rhodobacteraceae bacterium]|nr:FkbM family methyltransferase [Paracoccaceae bacterium]